MADTRQDILDAALVLFAEQGYDKTSLREIAEQVGVTKAALYYHFPSKEEILLALFEPVATLQDLLLEDLRSDLFLDPTTWAGALERTLDGILEHRQLFSLLERNAATLMALNHDGPFAESHRELHERTERLFADERLPLDDRVRLACAFGAVFGVTEVGGGQVFGSVPAEELRPMVTGVLGRILSSGDATTAG